MNRTALIRLAASAIIAAGGAVLARPALAAEAKTACDQHSIDNIANDAESYCTSKGFNSTSISVSCANGQVTDVTVTCFNYVN